MKNSNIVCYGELLIDMISMTQGNLIHSKGFLKKFGGAPANVAMGLAKLGATVRFIGKVGDDPFGHFLQKTLAKNNVQTDTLILSKTEKTTLAFVSLSDNGQRDFFFYRGAHEAIRPEEVSLPNETTIFHFGSLTQVTEESYKATEKLLDQAKKIGAIISYDPNVRESLWGDLTKARDIILATRGKVNILKVNEVEAQLLTGETDIQKAGKKLYTPTLDALFITLGEKGCYYKTARFEGFVPTISVKPIDTTGAGDAFNAGFLFALYEQQKHMSEFSEKELLFTLKRANIIGSLTTTKKGAISAFPRQAIIREHLSL